MAVGLGGALTSGHRCYAEGWTGPQAACMTPPTLTPHFFAPAQALALSRGPDQGCWDYVHPPPWFSCQQEQVSTEVSRAGAVP